MSLTPPAPAPPPHTQAHTIAHSNRCRATWPCSHPTTGRSKSHSPPQIHTQSHTRTHSHVITGQGPPGHVHIPRLAAVDHPPRRRGGALQEETLLQSRGARVIAVRYILRLSIAPAIVPPALGCKHSPNNSPPPGWQRRVPVCALAWHVCYCARLPEIKQTCRKRKELSKADCQLPAQAALCQFSLPQAERA